MRKKLLTGTLAVVLFALVLSAAAGCGTASTLPPNVLGEVGKVQITQDQFNAELATMESVYGTKVPDKQTDPAGYKGFQNYVLDRMIGIEVLKQEATALNVGVTDQDVQTQVEALKTKSFGGDQAKFDAGLKSKNLTLAQLQTYDREQLLVEKAFKEVTKNAVDPTDAEISSYYDAHKSSYYTEETRNARHILIIPASSGASASGFTSSTTTAAPTDADWAAALAKAQSVRADLAAGADWKTEAAKYSDDPGTKDSGGNIGVIKKGQMVAEFEQAVFSLKQDEISQPIKTVYGYHIIQVTSITPAKQQTLDEAKASIQSGLLNVKQKQVWADWLTKTKAELKVIVAAGWEVTTTTTAGGGSATTATTVSPTATTAPKQTTTSAS